MNLNIIREINQIIERDAKDTTYKFALLRSVIDSIQEFSHFNQEVGDRVHMKTGLLVFKWLNYYYPIIDSDIFIPQKNGETENSNNLKFRVEFRKVTEYYKYKGGMSVFINDLKKGRIDSAIEESVIKLIRLIRESITNQPMRYLGWSVTNIHYGIFTKEGRATELQKPSLDSMIAHCGTFSISTDYFKVFEYLGGFISGRNSIMMEWANFTASRPGVSISREFVLKELLEEPIDKREVYFIDNLYRQKLLESGVYCVWSGNKLASQTLNIDHILPFAVWKNNDLWNLIPVDHKINNSKRDMIPSPDFIGERKKAIMDCWVDVHSKASKVFRNDLQLGLIGNSENDFEMMLTASIISLQEKCSFLIEKRGMPAWKLLR